MSKQAVSQWNGEREGLPTSGESDAVLHDPLPERLGVDKFAIVCHGYRAIAGVNHKRLGQLDVVCAAHCRVARVADAQIALQSHHYGLIEHLRYQTHPSVHRIWL